ncbi:hypothetical protein WCE14_08835 [Acinetobacter schindleri]|uniref:hypothetical protein n=1 Tax=Acinetobacter schindleri TaxID=108981 RepID=UPI0034D6A785
MSSVEVKDDVMKNTKLWAVNIPEEPDSEEILHPVPSKEVGEKLVNRLRDEARKNFKYVGDVIAEAVTLEKWIGSAEGHKKYLEENPNWWDETTFLDVEQSHG